MTKEQYRLMRHQMVLVAQLAHVTGDPCEFIARGLSMWEAAAHIPELKAFASAFAAFREAGEAFLHNTNDGRFIGRPRNPRGNQ